MFRFLLAAVLFIQAAPQEDPDKAAAELLKKLEDKVLKAKTVHIQFEAGPAGREDDRLVGDLKLGGEGAFLFKVEVQRRRGTPEEILVRSDGRRIVVQAPMPTDHAKWTPATMEKFFRRTATQATFLGMFIIFTDATDPETAFEQFTPKEVKGHGKEKVGDVEASILSFTMNLKERFGSQTYSLRLWIDPVALTVLKRTIEVGGRESLAEKVVRFELDAAIPRDLFEFQSAAMLAEGQAIQIARSVALHARYTGRLPKSLDDLTRRPADLPPEVFWPDGGFWIGGAIPKGIAYSSDATHFVVGTIKEPIPAISPIGAPTDRLKKFYTARVHLQLLKAAAEGFHKSSSTLPKSAEELVAKSAEIRFWPEGGWIAKNPADPWGEPYVIRTAGTFSVSVANSKARIVKSRDLTPEERRGLEIVELPKLTGAESKDLEDQFKKLGGDRLSEREEATRAIMNKGRGVLRAVLDRLSSEKDPEVVSRLGLIRDQFQSAKPAWEAELKSLSAAFAAGPGSRAVMSANERNSSTSMKTITTAQADFRANDRDGNREMDFYCKDVAGLYGLTSEGAPAKGPDDALRLIEPALASADATEGRWDYPALEVKDQPKAGYLFAALKNYEHRGKTEKYDTGKGRNPDRFGFVAYPAEYGTGGRLTFIVNEDNTLWQKDLEGELVDTFPADPPADGWQKLD